MHACTHVQGLSPAQRRSLAGAAMVPVANATRLVPPCALFGRLREDLAPFAYEAPPKLAQQHGAVLAELGMQLSPTAADLMRFLLVRPLLAPLFLLTPCVC